MSHLVKQPATEIVFWNTLYAGQGLEPAEIREDSKEIAPAPGGDKRDFSFNWGLLWDQLASFKTGVYFARDKDKSWSAYITKPSISNSTYWSNDGDFALVSSLVNAHFPELDWKKSLIRKPRMRNRSWEVVGSYGNNKS